MTNPTNPLDDLQQFSSASLPSLVKQHSSGRRELRQQLLSRGITLTVRPASDADRAKMSRGEFVSSLPVRRNELKQSKKARAKRERAERKEEEKKEAAEDS